MTLGRSVSCLGTLHEQKIQQWLCGNFQKGFLTCYCKNPLCLLTPFRRSYQTCCSQISWSIFSLNLFPPEQLLWKAETGQEITWNINFTWLLLGRHLKIYHVNCQPTSDDYFLTVTNPELLWPTVVFLGYFNLCEILVLLNPLLICQFWCE